MEITVHSTFRIWCNLQELQNLSESYLFHNYEWIKHPAFPHVMEIEFPADDYCEAAGLYHELWKNRFDLPSLVRSWG